MPVNIQDASSAVQDIISQADVAAGLSLGEYTALTFAGALKCAHASCSIPCLS